ncbi:MAG: alpha-1,4 glucan phosphorylase [Porticoccaceae bacterium]|nr:MAG: alpha-1,4 glucan phosphorylase [Porticoccaceae bacterium]
MSGCPDPLLPDPLERGLRRHLVLTFCIDPQAPSRHYLYEALARAVRDHLAAAWCATRCRHEEEEPVQVAYLSMEYLLGRLLNNALLNLDLEAEARTALEAFAARLEEVEEEEPDAGLGNGGLGRLAACFLDSCATLEIPVIGYGLRYQYGMFHQAIDNGWQVEMPDFWLRRGNPWEIERHEDARRVKFYGRSELVFEEGGRFYGRWVDAREVLAVPYDLPVPGYRNGTVNTLRLWKAEGTEAFDLEEFNAGSYTDAVAAKNRAEEITLVLYPNDKSEQGKELRLRQQYFLASASLQDVLARWVRRHGRDFAHFAEHHVFQLNDTHPAVAVAELMRLLLDEYRLSWEEAWQITSRTMAYTNHTLLPEALEVWPVRLFRQLLPRPLDIIQEINARFLAEVAARWPGDVARQRRLSIIGEEPEPVVRMAHLAVVASFSVNGVAALHTRLLAEGLFRDFYELWPWKFNNKTNGVSPRRWLAHCNPRLRGLISEAIGERWIRDLEELRRLAPFAEDAAFVERFRAVKRANKEDLARFVASRAGVALDPEALCDVQVKRIHEYKRQLLNVLHLIHLYRRIVDGDTAGLAPRSVLFGGKAAPGYEMAKRIVKLIHNVAAVVNREPRCRDLLRVAFVPDYGVSALEVICPGAELSEQISTAGKEASGTGNMKLMMNGAVTIGTLDGANIEILEAVGEDNFFLFGLTAEEVARRRDSYDPAAIIAADANLSAVMALLRAGHFNLFEPGIFDPVIAAIESPADPWMVAADFASYVAAQERAATAWQEPARFGRMGVINVAAAGRFSSDRTIRQYRDEIWYRDRRGRKP